MVDGEKRSKISVRKVKGVSVVALIDE